jgi:hypothetical protein
MLSRIVRLMVAEVRYTQNTITPRFSWRLKGKLVGRVAEEIRSGLRNVIDLPVLHVIKYVTRNSGRIVYVTSNNRMLWSLRSAGARECTAVIVQPCSFFDTAFTSKNGGCSVRVDGRGSSIAFSRSKKQIIDDKKFFFASLE